MSFQVQMETFSSTGMALLILGSALKNLPTYNSLHADYFCSSPGHNVLYVSFKEVSCPSMGLRRLSCFNRLSTIVSNDFYSLNHLVEFRQTLEEVIRSSKFFLKNIFIPCSNLVAILLSWQLL